MSGGYLAEILVFFGIGLFIRYVVIPRYRRQRDETRSRVQRVEVVQSAPVLDPDELLTVDEVAAIFKVPKSTVYRWRDRGEGPRPARLPGILRWRRGDVQQWIDSRTRPKG